MIRLRKFSLNSFFRLLTVLIFLTVTCDLFAQRIPKKEIGRPLTTQPDTLKPQNPVPNQNIDPRSMNLDTGGVSNNIDTVKYTIDTIPAGSDSIVAKRDTFSVKLSKDSLEAPVQYYAEDSAVIELRNGKITLYGKTKTEYQTIVLTAPKVIIDQHSQILTAVNSKDSAGEVIDYAKFADKDQNFQSDTIKYNFKTQKGLTQNTITQSDQLFIHGETVKKVDKDVTFINRGFFTTCNLDEPHFGFRANKLKVINKKVAISGPVHPEFEGVPVPIYIPFGYFPLSQGRKSGLLPPQFATNDQQGLGLEGVGYYKVVNDYWDAKLYGNFYSYGSWSANINPTYRKRYKYQGAFNIGLQKTKRNFKGDPDYSTFNTYTVFWNHSTDSRARPGVSFSANVNASSTRYNESVLNDPILNYQNVSTSSITYSKTWQDKPFNLTASATHSQNNLNRTVSLTLPNLGFTVATVYPFQKKDAVGTKKWYQQLGIGYNGALQNQVTFYDTAFSLTQIKDTLQWGATHNIPITLSLPPILGGAVVVSPGISYSQVWVSQRVKQTWDSSLKKIDRTVQKGFNIDQQVAFSLSFNTAVYGTYQFKNSKIVAIRHVIRPTFGFNYRPDLSHQYYDSVQVERDTTGYRGRRVLYGMLQGSYPSGFAYGRSGGINFGLDNNLEMKVRNTKDTTGENPTKKIRLIDGLGFTGNYNFLAKNFKLSPISLYFRSNLFEKINISGNATLDPYQKDSLLNPIDVYTWKNGFSLGKISAATLSISSTFQSKPRDENKAKQRTDQVNQQLNDPVLANDRQRLLDYMQRNPSEFVDFNIPWQFSISYSLNYQQVKRIDLTGFDPVISSAANFSGSFSLTPKWNFSVNGYYDVKFHKIQTFSMAISREMHCWQLSVNVSPVGITRFFNFTISPKSGILQDLRINRTRSFYTGRTY